MSDLNESGPKGAISEPDLSIQASESWLLKAVNNVQLFTRVLGFILPYSVRLLRLRITAIYHNLTYTPVDNPKNVVIVGGSFSGVHLANWLANAVPTGYRVVLVEKNSHFNYLFAFPRYAVVPGYEQGAFIPYSDILRSATKKGSLLHIHTNAIRATASQLELADGQTIDYAYLVIATGSSQPPPAKMRSFKHDLACEELRSIQRRVAQADNIAILGSGAVGVEIAADIKSYFPEKNVTLFSSRSAVMPNFGKKLQIHVTNSLNKLGVAVRYNERPQAIPGADEIRFPDGKTEEFDFILSCTGQTPNSDIIRDFLPEAISKQTGRILVQPTLQLAVPDKTVFSNIFALGDVAEHGGPRMARAVFMQAGIVRDNVLDLIAGRVASRRYSPSVGIEGAIQLTIGKDESVAYVPGDGGKDMLFPGRPYPDDFHIAKGWGLVGAKYPGRPKAATN
ncbi:hypothetical protein BKA66DRAFT_611676 [Pyrenochaeta sp. MPI-SDFR-AT-0127]|nr:hypothetical protein BKA66DRAFT_611676 [Pyrenochaeta sp. MPI-SDFR-AT-0127]